MKFIVLQKDKENDAINFLNKKKIFVRNAKVKIYLKINATCSYV